MTLLQKIFALLLPAAALTASAQDPWLHIYYPEGSDYRAFDMTEVLDITFDDTTGTMIINGADGSETKAYGSQMDYFNIGPNVAVLRIVTEDPYLYEVYSKKEYLDATLYFEGRGRQDDFEMPVKVRGRGNSTWSYDKKPYRLKFTEKQRMLLPKKAKNFVLLANYIDESMMRNFAAFKFGDVIGMPWIHHAQPVDVYFNGYYKGSYMLTEKVGFNNGSVDIQAADEPNSIMLELDNNNVGRDRVTGEVICTEDDIFFASELYGDGSGCFFPVKIKDPDAPTVAADSIAWVAKWKADFDRFMEVVREGNAEAIFEQCDLESLVRYVMVFNFCCNQELDHPKSVYVYKTEGGKWYFGPCWDFDWAFGYQPTYYNGSDSYWGVQTGESYENPLFGNNNSVGSTTDDGNAGIFFYKLCNTEQFRTRFDELWAEFTKNGAAQFWADFDSYAAMLRPSANLQGLDREKYRRFDSHVEALRTWLEGRINFISNDPNRGLWKDGVFDKYVR